jgi:two-component system cell cycle sensor histidine kinase/response regulator CckA
VSDAIPVMAGDDEDDGPGAVDSGERVGVGPALSAVLERAHMGVYVLDGERRVSFVDDPHSLLFPPDTVRVGHPLGDAGPPLGEEVAEALRQAVDEGLTSVVSSPHAGTARWVEISVIAGGEGMSVCCRDVTVDHFVAEKLEDRSRRLRRKAELLDVAKDAIFVRELDHTISYWNHGAAVLYGRSVETALGTSARMMLQADPREYDEATTVLLRDGEWFGELRQVDADGRVWIAECRWQVSRDDQGAPSFVLCVVTDVTDLKREQEAMFRAQRMDSVGVLAGGMAHDLNNVFTPILLSTQLLTAEEGDPVKRSLLEAIRTSAERGADMIRQVLSFARGEESLRRPIDIRELLEELTAFCAEILPESVSVTSRIPDGMPKVLGNSTQLLQILMNFVTNARDSMPFGGRLVITAQSDPDGRADPGGAGDVVIAVEDSGVGMSGQTLAKVFEPFFTTKALERGTGLGLSTSIAIAQGHGGDIGVESTLGRGSRFFLRLPATAGGSSTRSGHDVPVSPPAQGRGERILIVDDETTIRTILQHTLEANGYETVSAGDGVEAVMLVESADEPVDLVLTDMMMPVMDGAAVAAYLSEHHPSMPLIGASGVTATEETLRAAHVGVRRFLTKPFSTHELLDAVRDALDSAGPGARGIGGADAVSGITRPDVDAMFERERLRVDAVRRLHLIDTPPEDRFDRITALARRIFAVPVAQISLVDKDDQFVMSGNEEGVSPHTPRSETFCDVTVQEREILVVPDAAEDPRFSHRVAVTGERRIRFYAGLALAPAGLPVGALCLIDTEPRDLTVREHALLAEMGRWVEREMQDTRDHPRAPEIQDVLAPAERVGSADFDVAGVRIPVPAAGSTFYDWDEGTDGHLGFTVAEVVGAGAGGPVVAALLRSAFQARTGGEPGETVQAVSDQLLADLRASDASATVFHGRFDPGTGRLVYVDAGHGLAAVVRAGGRSEPLMPTGLPLGIAERTGWDERTVHLAPGDALLSHTAGLLTLPGQDEGSSSDIARQPSSDRTAHTIIDAMRSAAGAGSPGGDITAVALTRPL